MIEIFSEFHKRSINVGAEMIKKKPNNDNKRLLEEYDADDEDMECAKKTRSF